MLRAEYSADDSFQKFVETIDLVEQASLYPDKWNTGAAFAPLLVKNEVTQAQLRSFLALPAGVREQDRPRAIHVGPFHGIIRRRRAAVTLRHRPKTTGGDHDLLLNDSDFASNGLVLSASQKKVETGKRSTPLSEQKPVSLFEDFFKWLNLLMSFWGEGLQAS